MSEILNMDGLPELPYSVEEAVNRLRVNLSFAGKDVKKILVISSMPNEGKSFVSMHLWRQTAEAGSKSIFVDADLRKSVVCDKYGLKDKHGKKLKGTSHYLSGDYPLEEAIYHTNIENADILPNSDNLINPSMLIEDKRFKEMLSELSDKYRYVFVDCPPLNLVSDGERIANLCDGAILVVRAGVTSKKIVRNSVRQLERAGCPLLGMVLNRVEGAGTGYYSKRYGGGKYYYGKRYGGKYYYGSKKYYYGRNSNDQYYYGGDTKEKK